MDDKGQKKIVSPWTQFCSHTPYPALSLQPTSYQLGLRRRLDLLGVVPPQGSRIYLSIKTREERNPENY